MRVEVFTTTVMEIPHFAPIVRALCEMGVDARFVSPQTSPKATAWGWDDADRTEALLTQLDLPWTKEPDYNADAVLTIQSEDFVDRYIGTRIRMTYGVGLIPPTSITNFSKPFDYHLVHGPFNQRVQFRYHALSSPDQPADRVKVIGYPKFDAWFQHQVLRETFGTLEEQRRIEGEKPVLLWLPTWGRSSSIPRYADAIFALADKYDIWVRPHHGTVHWERDRMALLAEGPCRVLDFDGPFEEIFAAASIVLADLSSGAFGEAFFLKKNLVGLSQWKSGMLVKMSSLIPICPDPTMLDNHVQVASEMVYGLDQERVRLDFVESTEGADGPRAAKIITEILG